MAGHDLTSGAAILHLRRVAAADSSGRSGVACGHRSRLVQLCVDVPAGHYDAELAFWRAATGWADEPVSGPEFHRLVHRAQSPVALLVQRLGEDDAATNARAHLDLGTDDIAAEVARIQALGAQVLWPGDGFIALRDPAGLPFCVTGNQPDR